MNERIIELRSILHLTQTEFGEKIGLTRNAIAAYERGIANPTGTAIVAIVNVFKVNQCWLETGEGEMFAPGRELDQVMEAVNDSPAMCSLLTAWSQLNEDNKAVLEEFIASYVADYNRRRAKKSSAELQKVFDGVDMDEDQRAQEKKTS